VGDRPAERRLLRPLDVDVDPVVVAGDVGELVDRLLGHEVPVRDPDLLALVGFEVVQPVHGQHEIRVLHSADAGPGGY
jgi:hypothetical protein